MNREAFEYIKALRRLENDVAQTWVQRDTQTLDRILAGNYTFDGAGDVLIDKEQWVAEVDYPGIRTTSALMISGYASMAMQPLLQAGQSTGVGLKKAVSSFTLQIYIHLHPP